MARRGYTILEVMIFLAITSVMFIYAVVAIGGRQKQIEYNQSVRDLESTIADVVNDVSAGYYPKSTTITCSVSGSGALARAVFSAGTTEQGGSSDCALVGKTLIFNASDGPQDGFTLGTLAGIKPPLSQIARPTALEMKPRMVYDLTPGINANFNENKTLRYGLKVTKIFNNDTPTKTYGLLALVSNFDASQASQKNGLMQTTLFASTIPLARTMNEYVVEVESLSKPSIETPTNGVSICVSYAGRLARIVVGERGDPTNVRSEMDMPSGGVCE